MILREGTTPLGEMLWRPLCRDNHGTITNRSSVALRCGRRLVLPPYFSVDVQFSTTL
jgi:hypothetical protein